MKNIVAVFAGGIGQRMNSSIPKQFLEIYGKPIIIHTLEKFQYNEFIDEIYVGCKVEYIDYFNELVKRYNLSKVKSVIPGADSGLGTIYELLKKIKSVNDEAVVLIHDGVRPSIDDEVISKNIESVLQYGNAITCVPSFETPVISSDGDYVEKYLDRKIVYTAKAPQSFKLTEIIAAYDAVRNHDGKFDGPFVDSCSIALNSGMKLKIVLGNRDNIKVTTSNDYIEILGKMLADDYSKFFKLENNKKKG